MAARRGVAAGRAGRQLQGGCGAGRGGIGGGGLVVAGLISWPATETQAAAVEERAGSARPRCRGGVVAVGLVVMGCREG